MKKIYIITFIIIIILLFKGNKKIENFTVEKDEDFLEVAKYFSILEMIVKSDFKIHKNLEYKPIHDKFSKTLSELKYLLENYQYFNEKGQKGSIKIHTHPLFNFNIEPELKIDFKNLLIQTLIFFYKKNTIKMDEVQLSLIKGITDEINKVLLVATEKTVPKWNIVLLNNNIDWNYPYTIGDKIFITKSRLDGLLRMYSYGDVDSSNNAKITFIHEYIHILQRKNPKAFQSFYEIFWNFKQIPIGKRNSIMGDTFLKTYWVTNPDGINAEYYVEHENEKYTPFLMLDPNNIKVHKAVLIKLDNDFNVLHTEESKLEFKGQLKYNVKIPIMYNIENMKFYQDISFGIKQNYHPNEIYANLVSSYLIDQGLISSDFREIAEESSKLLSKLEKY
jgi:hypothetical protein